MMTERQAIARAELLNTLAEQEREDDMLMMHFYKMEERKRQARRVLTRQQKEELRTIPFPLNTITNDCFA